MEDTFKKTQKNLNDTIQAIENGLSFIKAIGRGEALPSNPRARDEVIDSTLKLIDRLEAEVPLIKQELAKLRPS